MGVGRGTPGLKAKLLILGTVVGALSTSLERNRIEIVDTHTEQNHSAQPQHELS